MPALSRAHLLMGAATVEWLRGARRRAGARGSGTWTTCSRPSLDVLGVYQKHHLVPFGEYVPLAEWLPFLKQVVPSFAPATPGRELTVLELPRRPGREELGPPFTPSATRRDVGRDSTGLRDDPSAAVRPRPRPRRDREVDRGARPAGGADRVRLAPMICFDAIFPEINVAFARAEPEPEILVNPTNDAWYGYSSGPYQFLAIVRMRAIEAGKAVDPARLRRACRR